MIRRALRGIRDWTDDHWVEFLGIVALLLLLVLVMWRLIIHTVPPGNVGVMWYRFLGGTVTAPERVLGEGFHLIFPWDKIYIYNARLQRIDETVTGLSVDGLNVSVTVVARYVIESEFAGFLHKAVGPQYQEKLLQPELRALVLAFIAENEAEDLYSARRGEVQAVIQSRLQGALSNIANNTGFDETFIRIEDVLIEEIHLPQFVRMAIQEKERVRHISEAYEFRLQIEEKERQRKRIEAEGIRAFQEIIAPGITPSYLRWRGIEATLQLAQSTNSKVVIIGSNEDGLPLILNTGDAALAAEQQIAPASEEQAAAEPARTPEPLLRGLPEPLNGLQDQIRDMLPGRKPDSGTQTAAGDPESTSADDNTGAAAESAAESNDSASNPSVQSTAQGPN